MGSQAVLFLFAFLPIVAACAACSETAEAKPPHEGKGEQSPVHVDSVFPIEEEIRRFRATLSEQPRELGSDAPRSRDELVERFAEAIARSDTIAAARLMITRAEFGHLYFQHSRYTRPPYKMSPALLWFMTVQESEKGLGRTLAAFGGTEASLHDYRCAKAPEAEGPNRTWRDCVLELSDGQGNIVTKRLFGAILERGGRYKFLSFSSDF
jgi:hypothetical protein